MLLFINIALLSIFRGNTDLNISINPPSVTPNAPGSGIPDTVAYSTDCIDTICIKLYSLNPNEQYTQYETL